jgi:hypothetical protein
VPIIETGERALEIVPAHTQHLGSKVSIDKCLKHHHGRILAQQPRAVLFHVEHRFHARHDAAGLD